jgi:hypothetical protein
LLMRKIVLASLFFRPPQMGIRPSFERIARSPEGRGSVPGYNLETRSQV